MKRMLLIAGVLAFAGSPLLAQTDTSKVTINWNKTLIVSKTTPTLQLVENPMVRPGSSIHKNTFKALKELGADYVRYVPWFPYPKMAVAELKPPTGTNTYWDFTYLDSTMVAFMEATKGHSSVINFSTTPAWLWKTAKPVAWPDDAYGLCWDYNQGTELRDTTMKELTGYFSRLFSWYTKGGFTDELGVFHKSGHHYDIPYWEVLNEPDLEHKISVQLYTKMYDAIVSELKKISPQTKFVGLSLAHVREPEYFEYFLNAKNHKPGIKGNYVVAQGIKTKQGKKILLINKNKTEATVLLPADVTNSSVKQVDVSTRENAPSQNTVNGNVVKLKAFGVAVVEVKSNKNL